MSRTISNLCTSSPFPSESTCSETKTDPALLNEEGDVPARSKGSVPPVDMFSGQLSETGRY